MVPNLWHALLQVVFVVFAQQQTYLVGELDVGSCGQLPLSGWPEHNPTTWLRPSSTSMVSAESCSILCRAIVAPVERYGVQQSWTCAPMVTPRRCLTLSTHARWQSWVAGGLSRLHSLDDDAVQWLDNLGRWTRMRKKKKKQIQDLIWMEWFNLDGMIWGIRQRRNSNSSAAYKLSET